ncbi:unnamed protein product [Cylindrotheca closterium]|uniref:Uncharacterized protein n=1 Tax=Cylindrotheca closterium TaxID=2856 RepID=A0AAD2FCD1_9STRA|nr:unnamed protein product [Cylindrotheca closterium]
MTCTLCGTAPGATSPEGRSSYSVGSSLMVMGFLNRTIPVSTENGARSSNQQQLTCQEINDMLGEDPLIVNDGDDGSQECADQRSALMNQQDIYLDLPSYCGCPNSPAPRTCDFSCAYGDSNAMNEDLVVDKLEDGTKLTCGDILSAVPHIVDFNVCQDYQQYQSLCCFNFEASCHLCPASSSTATPKMEHSEKIIPSLQRTCGLVDQYFGTVLSVDSNDEATEECNRYRDAERENAIVDLESYCGCENAVAPNTCNFCAVEDMVNPNFVLRDMHSGAIDKLNSWGIAGNSMTCRAIAELAPIVTDDDFCQDLQYFQPICCPTDFLPTCTLCLSVAQNGPTLTRPDAIVPGRKKETCAQVDQYYFHLIQGDATACNIQRNGLNKEMDLLAYCGCPGEEPPNQCTTNFCESDDLIDEELVIGMGNEARTCGHLAEIAPFITNRTLCDWLEFAKPQCCQAKTLGSPCSVCPNQNQVGRPNSVVEHQTGTTCQKLDQTLQQLPSDDICTQVKRDWDFDLESFCGCEGDGAGSPVSPPGKCELCGRGEVLRNNGMALPDKPSWTCEMGQQQAPFVNSKMICETGINTDANRELCCEPENDPNDSDRSIDGAIEEAGLSDILLWAAIAAEILLVLVLLLMRRREFITVRNAPPNFDPDNIPETAALV